MRFRVHSAKASPPRPTRRTPPITANRPKMPMPDVFSTDTTAAACVAAGVAIGLVQLDSAREVDKGVGRGLEEAEVTGIAAGVATTTGPAAASPSKAGASKGVSAGAGTGCAGAGATRGAAGAV